MKKFIALLIVCFVALCAIQSLIALNEAKKEAARAAEKEKENESE